MLSATYPVPFYFPLLSGRYEVKPGFYKLGYDFGNGRADENLFQVDRQFAEYRSAKQHARDENAAKYICYADYTSEHDRIINQFIIQRLRQDHPDYFRLQSDSNGQRLECRLTGESLLFTTDGDFLDCYSSTAAGSHPYSNGFDALAMQVQEDLALVTINATENSLAAVHLCLPNHWDPREKVGTDFIQVHQPVPGMEKINQSSGKLLNSCLHQGPFVRFAWGLSSDTRLNHHPEPPPNTDPVEWQGRRFDRNHPSAWLRVERQTLTGLPEINGILFTIHTYHYALSELTQEHRNAIARAIRSMSTPSLAYKGLNEDVAELIDWLESAPGQNS